MNYYKKNILICIALCLSNKIIAMDAPECAAAPIDTAYSSTLYQELQEACKLYQDDIFKEISATEKPAPCEKPSAPRMRVEQAAKKIYATGLSPLVIALKNGDIITAKSIWEIITITPKECQEALLQATKEKQAESVYFLLKKCTNKTTRQQDIQSGGAKFGIQFQEALALTIANGDRKTWSAYVKSGAYQILGIMEPELAQLTNTDVDFTCTLLDQMNSQELEQILHESMHDPHGKALYILATDSLKNDEIPERSEKVLQKAYALQHRALIADLFKRQIYEPAAFRPCSIVIEHRPQQIVEHLFKSEKPLKRSASSPHIAPIQDPTDLPHPKDGPLYARRGKKKLEPIEPIKPHHHYRMPFAI